VSGSCEGSKGVCCEPNDSRRKFGEKKEKVKLFLRKKTLFIFHQILFLAFCRSLCTSHKRSFVWKVFNTHKKSFGEKFTLLFNFTLHVVFQLINRVVRLQDSEIFLGKPSFGLEGGSVVGSSSIVNMQSQLDIV